MVTGVRWPIRRWAFVLMVSAGVLLVAAVVAATVGLSQSGAARVRVVDQIDPELIQAQNLASALLNQETGVRGYLLNRQPGFLEPYRLGREQQDRAVAELRRLGAVGDTPAGRDLDAVLAAAGAWQRTAERLIDTADPALVDQGKTGFDAVRTTLDNQRTGLEQARLADTARLTNASVLLRIVLAGIAVLLVALFVALAWGFHRKVGAPITRLAAEVRTATDDLEHHIPTGNGPRELAELADDVEGLRIRLVTEVAQLALRTRELQRSNSDLEQFAYVASHDLQEPLRKVTSFCQLLERRYGGRLDEQADQYIGFAVDGARRMQVLIDDLLAFSRVGRHTGDFVQVDMDAVVDTAITNLDMSIKYAGAEVTHGPLPRVKGDPTLLTAVFQNLIGNAVKFRGEEPPRVEITAANGTFSVTDNGIGVESEYADRIFVIFQRLHPRSAYPGTGIGLAMVRKIVEYHGGRVWLDTTYPGPGTRFSFSVPSEDV